MTDEPRFTIHDCRSCGFCVSGVRRKAPEIGFDFRRLIREGIPISEVEHIQDQQLQKVHAAARDRIARENQE